MAVPATKAALKKRRDALLISFVERCIIYAEQHGRTLARDGSPVHAFLQKECEIDGMLIETSVTCSAMSNGSCRLIVREKGDIVFDIEGCYTCAPFNLHIKKTDSKTNWKRRINAAIRDIRT